MKNIISNNIEHCIRCQVIISDDNLLSLLFIIFDNFINNDSELLDTQKTADL